MVLELQQLRIVCPATPDGQLLTVLPQLNASLAEGGIDSPSRVAMYLAMICEETIGLRVFEERLSYSVEALCKTWHHRFPTPHDAEPYAHQPEKLANKVYADRLGNGDEESGEGWLYRGRGAAMLTGRGTYVLAATFLGVQFVAHPELVAQMEYAFRTAAWFWRWKHVAQAADKGDLRAATLLWNGGDLGLVSRGLFYDCARHALGIAPLLPAV